VKPISRATDLGIEIYDAEAELVTTVPTPGLVESHSVAGSLQLIAYVTAEDVVCVDRAGEERWRFRLGATPVVRDDCAFSGDDTLLWVYAPGVEAGRDGPDRWLALDAGTGEPQTVHELPCAGQGGSQYATPDGRYQLLDVGEGQQGSLIFRAGPELYRYPGHDRVLVAVSPTGDQLMTVHHEQADVVFHAFADGEILIRVPATAFGHRGAFIAWSGGYLDARTAIVVLSDDEVAWHHTVDVRTGEVTGTLPVTTIDEYDLQPLGDGGFLVTDTDGTLRRLTY
jgi:hypothetical protein